MKRMVSSVLLVGLTSWLIACASEAPLDLGHVKAELSILEDIGVPRGSSLSRIEITPDYAEDTSGSARPIGFLTTAVFVVEDGKSPSEVLDVIKADLPAAWTCRVEEGPPQESPAPPPPGENVAGRDEGVSAPRMSCRSDEGSILVDSANLLTAASSFEVVVRAT